MPRNARQQVARLAVVMWIGGLWVLPAAAQRNLRGQGDLSPAEIQRLFDAYAIVQAQEMLQLDDEHYGRFVSRLKSLQETRRRHQVTRQRMVQDLVRLANQVGSEPGEAGEADDEALRSRLAELDAHDEQAFTERRDAYRAVDEVLDLRQRARFRAFEQQMERRKLELLMRARQPNRRAR